MGVSAVVRHRRKKGTTGKRPSVRVFRCDVAIRGAAEK
ncbi:hypothetical protein IMCC9480_596 [Oxalobacteraceae bacterium IMCC9480]|nr:hypothetical protein IMCC9480_596 [Oxalobacteraceae bacterium IMCC9480]